MDEGIDPCNRLSLRDLVGANLSITLKKSKEKIKKGAHKYVKRVN
jgi:hypothetical protein